MQEPLWLQIIVVCFGKSALPRALPQSSYLLDVIKKRTAEIKDAETRNIIEMEISFAASYLKDD